MRQKRPERSLQHVDLLRQAADGLASRIEEILAGAGLTVDQWRVLSTLNDHGALSMSELSSRTRITGPTVTRAVDRLVERALLYRNVDPTDRRRVLVLPAERGKAVCRSLGPPIAEAEQAGLSALSAAEARMLRRLLERLATD